MTTTESTELRTIALDQIRAERNVRELNQGDVDALASSIELVGQLVPAIVYADGDGYVLYLQ
jgi:ParB-like chromosome segregation protein Spo0J